MKTRTQRTGNGQEKQGKGRGGKAPQEPQGGAQGAEGAQSPAVVEAEGGSVKVQGVEVAAASIPAGIPLPDGSTFRVVEAGTLQHDPEIDPGREPEEYEAAHPKMVELVASMQAFAARNPLRIGNEVPVVCRPGPDGEPLIVHGRRRNAAAQYGGTMLAVIVRPMSTRDARVSATVENTQREGPSVLGEARQYRDLREKEGMKVEEIAAAVGKTQGYVSKRLALLVLPEWAQAKLRGGELTEGTAYEGMARFARVPEPAASKMWDTLLRRWPELTRTGLTADRIRVALGEIARNLSRSLDPATYYQGEAAPLFDLAAHAAACKCGAPKVRLHDHFKEHPRCYDVTAWEALQEAARAERRNSLQKRAPKDDAGTGTQPAAAQPAAAPAPAPAAEEPAATPAPASTPRVLAPARRYAEPTWAEVTEACGPYPGDHVVSGDYHPGEVKQAEPTKLLDWQRIPPESVRFVQSPAPGLFRVVCMDREALKQAAKAAEEAITERARRIQDQERAAFREAAARVELRSAEALAAIVYHFGDERLFGVNTAELLGVTTARGKVYADLAKLPKRDLTLVVQGMVHRIQKGDTRYRNDDRTEQARTELWAESTEDFRTLLAGLPAPELTPAGRVQDRAGVVEALWEDVQGLIARQRNEEGGFRDELDEFAPTWAAQVAAFRNECSAIQAEAEAHGLDLGQIDNPHGKDAIADLIAEAAGLLTHPVYRLIEEEAAKQAASEARAEDGEGAQAPAPEAGAEPQTEGGENTQGPDPEAGAEPQAEGGENTQGPAPEAGAEQGEQDPQKRGAGRGGRGKGRR